MYGTEQQMNTFSRNQFPLNVVKMQNQIAPQNEHSNHANLPRQVFCLFADNTAGYRCAYIFFSRNA